MPAAERHNFADITLNLLAREFWLVSKGPSSSSLVWKHRSCLGIAFPSGCTSSLQSNSVSILRVSHVEPAHSMPNFLLGFPGSLSSWNIYTLPLIWLLLVFPCYIVPLHQFPSVFIRFSSKLEAHCSYTSLTERILLLLLTGVLLSSAVKQFSRVHPNPVTWRSPRFFSRVQCKIPYRADEHLEGGWFVWFCSQQNWQTLPYR